MPKFNVLFLLFFNFWFGISQNEIYQFTHVSEREGLSQSSAIVIDQDPLNQIWIGTRDGLNKYDGTSFTVYRNEKDNPFSISNNDILSIEQDSYGFTWVGTAIGLNKYDPKKDIFKRYIIENEVKSLLGNSVIWGVKELSNKELWVGTPGGLLVYDRLTDSFKSVLKRNQIRAIFEAENGDLFIGTRRGLKKLVGVSEEGYKFKTIKGTNTYVIQEIIETSSGTLLLGTQNHSVLEYNISKGTISSYFKEKELKGKNKNARQLLFDNKGKLWIGTYNGLQIADDAKKIKELTNNINDSESISDNFIKALFKDSNGSVWVGTYHGGVNIWDESNINFITITQKPERSGLGFKVVSSIESNEDFIFFGTEGGGISVLNIKTKEIEYIKSEKYPTLKNDNVKSLFLTKDNKLWIGMYQNGFAVYDIVTKSFDKSPIPKKLLSYLDNLGVYSITQHPDGDILLGTTGKGVIKYNYSNKTFKNFYKKTKLRGLTNGIIRDIMVDSKNNIWISTSKGLNLIDGKGKVKTYFYSKELAVGYGIITVFEDFNGVFWAGTDINGLFKLNNDKFEHVDIKIEDTPLLGVKSIIEDDNGYFWISTANQGIVQYSPRENVIIAHYSRKEGLSSNQFNNNASLRLSNSRFFFGGPAGAVNFNPNNLIKNNSAPQVIIADLKVKNQSISANDETKLLTNTIAYTKSIELSHDQGNFSISFSIPNYVNSSSNRYKYRLKGLEEEWNETSQNIASYTIQSPGNYTFQVKGINSDGVSNKEATTLKIRVNPAPWRTWWAFLFYSICIFVIVYYLLNILKSKTKLKHQLELEHIEAEQIKKVNKAKLEFFTNISHEFRTPLTLILGPLHQILENYRGSSLMYKKIKVVESSANHLLKLINRLMDFRKLENNLIKLETAEGNIIKFLKEIFLSFSEYAKDGNYDYSFETPKDQILVYYDRYKLERVFYNLISNAFRYTPKNGKIVIRVVEEKENVRIQVEDSGVGIAKEYHDKIFERFFELSLNNKPDNDYNKGTGIGLSIVKNIVDLHKGKIFVDDNTGNVGSVFSVLLPLGRKHLLDTEIIQDFKFSDDLSQYVDQLQKSHIELEDDVVDANTLKDKPTIVIVEDNKPLRKFMKSLLIENYKVLEAENGKVALKIAIKEQVDLIVSDVVMPVMTGTELCSLIKEDIRTSHIPVILLTSRTSLIFKLEGLESGADDYISKPFDVKEYKLRIKNMLSSISRLKQKINSTEIKPQDDIVFSSLDDKLYDKALLIVENNIANEQFDIHFFCDELGVSRTVLFRKIKAWTDFTPKEFIQHVRLKKAAQFLEKGKLNISQISYQVGFKNPKYFSKCFRKKFGKTPTEYIKTFSDY